MIDIKHVDRTNSKKGTVHCFKCNNDTFVYAGTQHDEGRLIFQCGKCGEFHQVYDEDVKVYKRVVH